METGQTFRFADLRHEDRTRVFEEMRRWHASGEGAVAFSVPVAGGRFNGLAVLAGLAGAAVLFLAILAGFGKPGQSGVIDAESMIPVYALGSAVMVWALLSLAPARWLQGPPGPPGVYVFAGHLVDARRERVVVHSLAGLRSFSATSAGMKGQVERIRIVFTLASGATQAFIIHGKAAAERGIARLRDLDASLRAGSVAGNVQAQRNIDPFFGMTVPEDAGTAQRLLTSLRVPSVARALVATVLGLALALPTWWIRNQRSDDAQFAETTRLGTEAALKAYLLHPLNHKAEVEAALPRAAFVEAKKEGTVTALRKVLQQYPGKGIDEDVRKEIKAIYEAAFDRFKAKVQRNDEALLGSVRAALGRAESSGHPGVDLVFVRPSAVEIAALDNRLKGLAWSTSGMAAASSHFQGNTASARERRITSELVSAFKSVFPQDVLTPQPVERASGQRPSITIGYSIKPSGATYTSKQTGRMFVGVLIGFTSELRGADASAPWRFKLDVLPPDTFSVSGKSPDDGLVYGEMANRAFDQLSLKLVNAFFGSKSI